MCGRGEHVIARVTPAFLHCNRQFGFEHGPEAILVHFFDVFTLSASAAVDPTATVFGRLHREQRGLKVCQLQRLVAYDLAGGVGVCVLNMVRGIMRWVSITDMNV
jgi:hypothetical protein